MNQLINTRGFSLHLRVILELTCSVCLMLSSVAILNTTPPVTYQLSIYAALPAYYWTGLLIGFLGSFSLLILDTDNKRRTFYIGCLFVSLFTIFLIYLPLIVGYTGFAGGDPLTHLGIMKQLASGQSSSNTIYPWMHLFGISVKQILNMSYMHLTLIMPPSSYVTSILFLITLVRNLSKKTIFPILLSVCSIPVLTEVATVMDPYHTSIFFIPSFLFIIEKYNNMPDLRWRPVLLILIIASVFAHPILIFIGLASFITLRTMSPYVTYTSVISYFEETEIFIWITLGTYWLYHTRSFVLKLASSAGLYGNVGDSAIQTYTSYISIARPTDLLLYVIFRYGSTLILLFYSGVLYLYGIYDDKQSITLNLYTFLLCLLLGLSILGLFIGLGPNRFFPPIKIFSIVIISILLYRCAWDIKYNDRQTRLGIAIATMVILMISLGGMFPSYETTKSDNRQVTEQQISIVHWTGHYGESNSPVGSVGINVNRMDQYLQQTDIEIHNRPPKHFEYINRSYLITSKSGKNFYPEAYPNYSQFWNYRPVDYKKLDISDRFQKVYSNGDGDVYLTNY